MNMTHANYPHPRTYCRAWRTAKQIAAKTPHRQIAVFRGWFFDEAARVYEGFIEALHARINTRGELQFVGRKYDDDYTRRLWQDCRLVRDHARMRRIVRPHDFSTQDVKRRFTHIITHLWEE